MKTNLGWFTSTIITTITWLEKIGTGEVNVNANVREFLTAVALGNVKHFTHRMREPFLSARI